MRVPCENCGATYNIPDEKVKGKKFRFKCKRCGNIVRVRPDTTEERGKMTMEIAAVDVQPRMTGEMAAAKVQAPESDVAKTSFEPPKAGRVKPSPTKAEVAPKQATVETEAAPKQATVETAAAPRQAAAEPKAEERPGEEAKSRKATTQTDQAPAKEAKPRLTIEGKALPQKPAESHAAWFLAYSKNKRGPMTVQEIQNHLLEVNVSGEVWVWKAGFENWKKIREAPEFSHVVEALERGKSESTPAPRPEASQPASQEAAKKPAERRTFTDLVGGAIGDGVQETPRAKAKKLDISQLMGSVEEAETVKKEKKKTVLSAKKGAAEIELEEYIPPKKKEFPIVQISMLVIFLTIVLGTPLTLAYLHIIEIPLLDEAPFIGQLFKKEQVDHYAGLREQWEMLIKIDEAKVALKQMKVEEEKRRLEEERQKALQEKKARRERALARNSQRRNGARPVKVFEMDFSNWEDAMEMDTIGELSTDDISRKAPLSQSEINKVISKNMRKIAKCVQTQRKNYESISGTMILQFMINRRGTIVSSAVLTPKFNGQYVGDCIAATVERIKFPKSGGSVTASYPFKIK